MMQNADAGQRDVRLPLLLLCLSAVVSLLTGTVSLVMDRTMLATAQDNQNRAAQEGERLRHQVDALLTGATALANNGDTGAKAALEAMGRQGVTYTPPPGAPPPGK